MKTRTLVSLSSCLFASLSLLLANQACAQGARFFRVVGPWETEIVSLSQDGTITWTNAGTGTNCVVQTTTALSESNWLDYLQVPVSNAVVSMRLFDPNPPEGMAFIPAGSFTMGNCMDPSEGYSDELPLHTVYVSAFYMDRYDVTKSLWDSVYHGPSRTATASIMRVRARRPITRSRRSTGMTA